MVSKMLKRTTPKSIKERRRSPGRRRKSPAKSPSAVVIATLNESFFSCRRSLVKIFSKLVKIATPKGSPKKHGFRKLKKFPLEKQTHQVFPHPNVSKTLFFGLPPLQDRKKKTVFLDLDETLIHSSPDPPPEKFDFIVRPQIDGEIMNFYVLKRPGVDELLEFLSGKFEIVIFTAGLEEYASAVLDELDKNRVINHRLFRDSCREMDGKFVKDLSQVGRDLWKVVIVDDNPSSYSFQPENAIRIRPFVDDMEDQELGKLIEFFRECEDAEDVRDTLTSIGARLQGKGG
uniref:Protein-serine/threonine phosphatase n=1 Tax=Opuntia streptacantha TaxID=393608 RepID=A0A7C9AKM4_OPUST